MQRLILCECSLIFVHLGGGLCFLMELFFSFFFSLGFFLFATFILKCGMMLLVLFFGRLKEKKKDRLR